jgi:hypothetical protein
MATPPIELTLEALQDKLGKPDPTLVEAIRDEETREEFVALGSQIASRHILSDAPRIYGVAYAFFSSATDAQRETIDASQDLIAVGVFLALELRALNAGTRKANDGADTERSQAEREAAAAFTDGRALRTRTVKLLKGIAGRSAKDRKRVDDQTGTAENAESLAQGLEAQATLLREFIGHTQDKIAARVALFGANEARALKLEEAATRIRDTSSAADTRSVSKVRQLEIDFMDGVNLHVLGELIHAFEAAHDMDASIPRLVPIATRRMLARHTIRNASEPAPNAPPETP